MRFIYLTLLFILTASLAVSQEKWIYSITPDSEGWKNLNYQERRETQQIPEKILSIMSTETVFQAWLDLPGRMELLAFNSMQQGFDFTVKTFNVLQELLKRKDVGSVVLNYYLKMNIDKLGQIKTDKEKGKFITDIGFIEFFLSQQQVLNSLSTNDKKMLFKETFKRIENKTKLKQNLKRDPFWEETGMILSVRILRNLTNEKLLQSEKQNVMVKKAIDLGEIHSEAVYNDIYQIIMEYYKNN